jgi:hypothetical protein
MTYRFQNDLVIPFTFLLNNLEDSHIEIKTKFLVCADICIPQIDSFSLVLKNGILNIKPAPNELLKWKSLIPATGPPVHIVFPNQNRPLPLISHPLSAGSYFYPSLDRVIPYSLAQKITLKNQTPLRGLALSMLETGGGLLKWSYILKKRLSEIKKH